MDTSPISSRKNSIQKHIASHIRGLKGYGITPKYKPIWWQKVQALPSEYQDRLLDLTYSAFTCASADEYQWNAMWLLLAETYVAAYKTTNGIPATWFIDDRPGNKGCKYMYIDRGKTIENESLSHGFRYTRAEIQTCPSPLYPRAVAWISNPSSTQNLAARIIDDIDGKYGYKHDNYNPFVLFQHETYHEWIHNHGVHNILQRDDQWQTLIKDYYDVQKFFDASVTIPKKLDQLPVQAYDMLWPKYLLLVHNLIAITQHDNSMLELDDISF